MELFDAHTHINEDYTDEERAELVSRIEHSDVLYAVDAGSDLATSKLAVTDAKKYYWCYAAVGYHPHETKHCTPEILEEIRVLAKYPKVVAIGEIGLDFHYDLSERDTQRKWFREQIRMAEELKMPIVIHTREADQETMDILKEEGAFSKERKAAFPERPSAGGGTEPDARVLLHCYSGSREMAEQYVDLGATLSICGPVTFKNNRKTKEVAAAIPLCYLTSETDAPYLTPEPFRGKPNCSPYMEYTVRKIAELKNISYEEAAKATCENAKRFYGIR
ncbi:MAG: TatD family hydrolase [Eubacteriales bacterium]|nr:TatD family hydrolase [Eubacteriales bacterium]